MDWTQRSRTNPASPATEQPGSFSRGRPRKFGEGAERPGLARCVCVLPFRRDRPPRAAVIHAPSGWRPLLRAWPDHRRRPCGRRRAADMAGFPVSDPPRGARRAGRGHPSTSARTPGLSSARASSLDHSPPPSRNVDPTPSPPTGWGHYAGGFGGRAKTGVLNPQGVERAGCFSANATIISGQRHRFLLPLREKVARRAG